MNLLMCAAVMAGVFAVVSPTLDALLSWQNWLLAIVCAATPTIRISGGGAVKPSLPFYIAVVGRPADAALMTILLLLPWSMLLDVSSCWVATVRSSISGLTTNGVVLLATIGVANAWPASWSFDTMIVAQTVALLAAECVAAWFVVGTLVRLTVGPSFSVRAHSRDLAGPVALQWLVEAPLVVLAIIAMSTAPWSVLLLIIPVAVSFVVVRQRIQLLEAMQDLSTDSLTGVMSRSGWEQEAAKLVAATPTAPASHVIFMCDIDDFKRANDTFGHLVGDEMLAVAGAALKDAAGEFNGIVGRHGGEEFVVACTIPSHEIAARGEAMRAAVAAALGKWGHTVSVGSAVIGVDERLIDAIGRADFAMYSAKRDGKNRVVAAAPLTLAA